METDKEIINYKLQEEIIRELNMVERHKHELCELRWNREMTWDKQKLYIDLEVSFTKLQILLQSIKK